MASAAADPYVIIDFNRKSSGHAKSISYLFVGVLAKLYYQPARKISKKRFHLVLPEITKSKIYASIPDFK